MSQQRYNIRIEGVVKTLAPITVVPPNSEEVVKPDGSKYSKVAFTVLYQDGLRETRPIIPGSTLRGRLRRAAVEVYRRFLGTRIPLAEFHLNAVGGIKGAEKEEGYDVVMRDDLRARNPVLSLFGAGSPWIGSKATVESAVPQHPVQTLIVGGVRSDDGRRDKDFFAKVDDEAVSAWANLVGANAERTARKNDIAAIKKKISAAKRDKDKNAEAKLAEELKSLQNDGGDKSNPVSMPIQHEAIPAGTLMSHAMAIKNATEEEIGLFFAALNLMTKETPNVGQHESFGYGLFTATYEVSIENAGSFDPFVPAGSSYTPIGTVTLEPNVGMTEAPERVLSMMKAFKTALEAKRFDFSVTFTEDAA